MMPVNVTIFMHILLPTAGLKHVVIDMLHPGEVNFISIVFPHESSWCSAAVAEISMHT